MLCKIGTEIYPPDWCTRNSCLEHHGVLGRRCFFCLSKWTWIYLSDSKLGALRTTSKHKPCGQRERGKRRHSCRYFPFIASGQVARIGSGAAIWTREKSTPLSVQVQKINWFCSLSPLLHCCWGVCAPMALRGEFCPFTPGRGSRAPRILCQFLPKWQSWPFLFFNCFLRS